MSINHKIIEFRSPLASIIHQFIQEKRACGYKYKEAPKILKCFDDFLCTTTINQKELPKAIVLQWLTKQPLEQPSTYQRRVGLIRQLADLMVRLGYIAYVVPWRFGTPKPLTFAPHIFTCKEIKNIIRAADNIKPSPVSPIRHIILPEIFRLLYGCGFRLGEVLNLRVHDVDLQQGVITVREGKHGKDRLVPPAIDVVERLRIYTKRLEKNSLKKQTNDSFFFPSPEHNAWHNGTIYTVFRQLLHQCSIPHAGRGKGR